nr:uncharacterized protein C1orf127 homolog [Loxodonta africana]
MERVKAEQAAQHILPHPSLLSCRALCLACALSAEFTWTLPFKSNRDTPSPALEISTDNRRLVPSDDPGACQGVTLSDDHVTPTCSFLTIPLKQAWERSPSSLLRSIFLSADKVECFSDYMALWIPKSQVKGLRQWLSRTLHLPGTWRTPRHLDPFLAKCGYFLHPAPHGDFIFRALYSASLVQKEKANYRLEIRIFQKGVRRLEQSDGYVMKCPMTTPRLGQVHVHCGSTFVQVSRPLPLENSSGQPPWLLSLRGELAASLEDASLIGLYVDINATSITIQSPRPELLQRWEVLNTSTELLPLWLVSGYSAYSLEATCPLVSSQPELEVLVHIPKQRLGLVKRGFHFEETLSLRFLRVHQSSTFTVTESQDFVVVSIPAAGVLRVQQCQDGQEAPGTQAFYRVDLSLEFAEMATPVLWTVENFFQCVGSGTELPASAAMLRTAPSPQSPGPETPPAGMPSVAFSLFQAAGSAASAGLGEELSQGLCAGLPMDRRGDACSLGPPALLGEAGLPGHFLPSAMPFSGSTGAAQTSSGSSIQVSPASKALTMHLSSGVTPPRLPLWRFKHSQVSPVSAPSVTLTESLGTVSPDQGLAQPPGSPLVLGAWSKGEMGATAPIPREPDQASEEFQPLMRPSMTGPAEKASGSCHSPRGPQKTSFIGEATGPPQKGSDSPQEGAGGHLDLWSPEPHQDIEMAGLTTQLGKVAPFTTPALVCGALRPLPRCTLSPQPGGGMGGGGGYTTSSPSSLQTWSLWSSTETSLPSLVELGHPSPAGQGASPQQELMEPMLAASPESYSREDLGFLCRDHRSWRSGDPWTQASFFARPPILRAGLQCRQRAAGGSRGQHNPPFQPCLGHFHLKKEDGSSPGSGGEMTFVVPPGGLLESTTLPATPLEALGNPYPLHPLIGERAQGWGVVPWECCSRHPAIAPESQSPPLLARERTPHESSCLAPTSRKHSGRMIDFAGRAALRGVLGLGVEKRVNIVLPSAEQTPAWLAFPPCGPGREPMEIAGGLQRKEGILESLENHGPGRLMGGPVAFRGVVPAALMCGRPARRQLVPPRRPRAPIDTHQAAGGREPPPPPRAPLTAQPGPPGSLGRTRQQPQARGCGLCPFLLGSGSRSLPPPGSSFPPL